MWAAGMARVKMGITSPDVVEGQAMDSTYRVQLTPGFGFADVAALAGYLRELGVTHLYLSPILQAVPTSLHGYDITDHGRVRAEFGGVDGLRELAATAGLRLLVDIVPNHMTVPVPESGNIPLWNVLRDGPASPYAKWFDIDWSGGGVAMPVLGAPLDEVLRAGELTVDGDVLRYFDHEFPVRPGTAHLPLDELVHAQYYRLVPWREGPGYRRFFDVSSLIGVRVEDPEVFEETHRVMLGLVAEGIVHGLRVDHPDGLADPLGYLTRLHERAPVWTLAEKILVGDERLPADWPCDGTTGYDALNRITRLFVDESGADPLIATFVKHTGMPPDYDLVRYESKKHVVELFFRAEVDRLIAALGEPRLRAALVELLVAMPVYRAYVTPGEPPSPQALRVIMAAAWRAAEHAPPEEVAEVAEQALYGPPEFVTRFQQTCGPVMAKGVEDTALYRWYPLACLNEVGGEPDEFALPPERFHAYCADVAPRTMTTLSTHDTKRSEDVRARLAVLSELPYAWEEAVDEWSSRVRFDPQLDYLAWQNLMAAWPISVDRFADYLLKAAREAKTAISWMNPDEAYERGVREFAARAVAECGESVARFTARLDPYAMSNSLGQKVVQLLMPGVPDVYQGNEVTDFSLVDPDNRRPIDFAYRRALLDRVAAAGVAAAGPGGTAGAPALNGVADGHAAGPGRARAGYVGAAVLARWDEAKLLVTRTALRLRGRIPDAAPYRPLTVDGGDGADRHALAFARGDGAIAVVTRLPVGLERRGGWRGATITLPPGRWRDLLTGCEHTGRIPMAHLLARLPVALLESRESEQI